MHINKLLHQSKPKASTSVLPVSSRINLFERLKEVFLVFRRNAYSRICNRKYSYVFTFFTTDRDFASFRGKLDSVAYKVIKDLDEAVSVCLNISKIRIQLKVYFKIFSLGKGQ